MAKVEIEKQRTVKTVKKTTKITQATLRLFRAVPRVSDVPLPQDEYEALTYRTTPDGFIFTPDAVAGRSPEELSRLVEIADQEVGLSGAQANSSFHKSWSKIANASMTQLVVEQILHYITTYGFEAAGFYDEASVYIPLEPLDVPQLKDEKLPLTVIRGLTKEQLRERTYSLLSGVALKESTVKDAVTVCQYLGFAAEDVQQIRNRETRAALFLLLGLTPKDPTEFLRLLVSSVTESTLLIKNKKTVEKLRQAEVRQLTSQLRKYETAYGLASLSSIFLRFKPLFLAMKRKGVDCPTNTIINQLRKLAEKNHKPMRPVFLNEVTAVLRTAPTSSVLAKLADELAGASIFQKIKLAYALQYRTQLDVDSILYRIRNGRSFATEFSYDKPAAAAKALKVVRASIVESLRPSVEGKRVFFPERIQYTLPATEKQFTGSFPSGTSVSVPENLVFGIHWENQKGHRIDLDLSLLDASGTKYGWDAYYRSEDRGILFSGDVTDAPKGASELFRIRGPVAKVIDKSFRSILFVNYFNYNAEVPVPVKIFVAQEPVVRKGRPGNNQDYVVDPNNIVATTQTVLTKQQRILGLVTHDAETNGAKFIFAESDLGNTISVGRSYAYGYDDEHKRDYVQQARDYLFALYRNPIDLRSVLVDAGAEVVERRNHETDVDLSPDTLGKDSILSLFRQ